MSEKKLRRTKKTGKMLRKVNSFQHLHQHRRQLLLQLWINLNIAQFFDIEDHLMGLEEKLFPHSILHPPAPLPQPGSVFKDVTTNSNRLQKGERATVRLGAVTSSLTQQALKVYLQVQVKGKKREELIEEQ